MILINLISMLWRTCGMTDNFDNVNEFCNILKLDLCGSELDQNTLSLDGVRMLQDYISGKRY